MTATIHPLPVNEPRAARTRKPNRRPGSIPAVLRALFPPDQYDAIVAEHYRQAGLSLTVVSPEQAAYLQSLASP